MHAMVKKARELTSQKKFDEAINLLKPLIKSPYMEEVLFQCGKTMIHAGKEKEAWVYFDELIDVNEDNKYSVYLWLAKHKSFAESNIKMGEEYYKIAISDESPVREEAILSLAQMYCSHGKKDGIIRVEKMLEKALNEDSSNIRLIYQLAKLKYKLGKFEESLVYYLQFASFNPPNKLEINETIRSLEEKLHKKPSGTYKTDEYVKNLLMKIKMNMGACKYDEVILECQELIKLNSHVDMANDYMKAANLALEIDKDIIYGKYEEAVSYYQQVDSEPNKSNILQEYLKRLKGIIEKLIKLIKLNAKRTAILPSDNLTEKEVLLFKADTYLKFGFYDKALPYYEELFKTKAYSWPAICGIVAIMIKNRRYEYIKQFIEMNKSRFTDTERHRLYSYINQKKYSKLKEKQDSETIKHIINRHSNDFSVDISELYNQILENVDDVEAINGSSFEYYVRCDKVISTRGNQKCIKVVAFLDRTNIITMYPVAKISDPENIIDIKLGQKTNKLK